ncbi:hypothetical protein DDB_G0276619 [Dictyostelium discoideum AX4]|uniref:Uncharacterized protein n=1 Tax=Dictyostelium discoideum TaxID=44689 RepID=Q551D1_DICDI|nr:hypothetical protein DDB_G0276619 [Dictyostelium discoideum AX4]EAL69122.1 hypothetical protein DDB_G0276619 [Dictyostelium discoideum AX4]|eukprot:XP_643062.1 hypothetical protein DDB_G0276619 [Dictyostelium discoideum AX4]
MLLNSLCFLEYKINSTTSLLYLNENKKKIIPNSNSISSKNSTSSFFTRPNFVNF